MLKSKCPTVSVTSGGEDSSWKAVVMIARDANSSVCKGLIKWNKHHYFIQSFIQGS